MPYRYRDDIGASDIAFEAWGETEEDMMVAAADALMNTMVENPEAVSRKEKRTFHVESTTDDMLLFHLLEELIFLKDTEGLLLRISTIRLQHKNSQFMLCAEAFGEECDPNRHKFNVDVKAVTLHCYSVEKTPEGWKATVVLDV